MMIPKKAAPAFDAAVIEEIVAKQTGRLPFSGVVSIREKSGTLLEKGYGLADRTEKIPNCPETRFATASGSKIFTAAAICRLVEEGSITFDTLLEECLDISFPAFDRRIAVHHLLTHSSGIPDYFDEERGDDYESLWKEHPVHAMQSPEDFLPLFRDGAMKFAPGSRFAYCNSGFIVLALIVEQQTGLPFTRYVEEEIFAPCSMWDSGYFSLDSLPKRTARGYIDDGDGGPRRTNIYAVPPIGTGDGGAFVTARDMARFWSALLEHSLLNRETTEMMLHSHIEAESAGAPRQYGYGVWIDREVADRPRYFVAGADPGVSFASTVYPAGNLTVTVLGNEDRAAWSLFKKIIHTITSYL